MGANYNMFLINNEKMIKEVERMKLESMTNKEQFYEWMKDGNAIKFNNGYSTQDAQWRNRIPTLPLLYKYFLREFIFV